MAGLDAGPEVPVVEEPAPVPSAPGVGRSYDDLVPGSLAWIAAHHDDGPAALEAEPADADTARRDARQQRESERAAARQAKVDAKAAARREKQERRAREKAEREQAKADRAVAKEQERTDREEARRAEAERVAQEKAAQEEARRLEEERRATEEAERDAARRERDRRREESKAAAVAALSSPPGSGRGGQEEADATDTADEVDDVVELPAEAVGPVPAAEDLTEEILALGDTDTDADAELDETAEIAATDAADPAAAVEDDADPRAEAAAVATERRREKVEAKQRAREEKAEAKARRAEEKALARSAAGPDDVPEPPSLPGEDEPTSRSGVVGTIGLAIGVLGLLASVLLALAALLVAFGFDPGTGPLGALGVVCDPITAPLRGLVSFSGDNAEAKAAFVAYGAGSILYLVAGVVGPTVLRPRDED